MKDNWRLDNITQILEASRENNLTVGEFLDYIEFLQTSHLDKNYGIILLIIH